VQQGLVNPLEGTANHRRSDLVDSRLREAQDRDEAFCIELLPRVSRTFALSIEMLPEDLREPVRVAYLLCRIVDTIEDDAVLGMDVKDQLFDLFDRPMADDSADVDALVALSDATGVGEGADRDLILGSDKVFRRFRAMDPAQRDAIRPHVVEMSKGMRSYARRVDTEGALRIRDIEDFESYCYYVAGTVGELLSALFLLHTEDGVDVAAVHENAVRFGLALQFVNIVKDVGDDAKRGVCFIPLSLLAKHELTVEDLLDPTRRDDALGAIRELTDRARGHLNAAEDYTFAWPGASGEGVRLFCSVPLALALGTLEVVDKGEDSLRRDRNPKVTREFVGQILAQAGTAAGSDEGLKALFAFARS